MSYPKYKDCVDACITCANLCNYCAHECLQEYDVNTMTKCIQLNMECAAVCYTAAKLMSMKSEKVSAYCRLCASFCTDCSNECGKHEMKHCQECAEVCRKCAEECNKM